MALEASLSPVESLYDPQTLAPQTAREARQFVKKFSGVRPPGRHPLNFEQFDMLSTYPSFVVLPRPVGNIFPAGKNQVDILWQFMDRLSQPAIPLVPGKSSLKVGENSRNYYQAVKLLGALYKFADLNTPQSSSKLPDITAYFTMVVYKSLPDFWRVASVITEDCLKNPRNLLEEIYEFKKIIQPLPSQIFQMNMKRRVLYLQTGVQY